MPRWPNRWRSWRESSPAIWDANGMGITVSYWKDEAAIKAWKQVAEHLFAQKQGKAKWYDHYITRVARVERAYDGPENR